MNLSIRLAFEDVFPDEEKQHLSFYIKGIGRSTLKKIIVLILNASKPGSSWQNWDTFMYKKWFSKGNADFANKIHSRVLKLERKYTNTNRQIYSILSTVAGLTLLEHMLQNNANEDDKIDLLLTEQNVFKALLVINSDLNLANDQANNKEKFEGFVSFPVGVGITNGMAHYEIENVDQYSIMFALTTQLIKALYLFDFIKEIKPHLYKAFLEKYDCESFVQYVQYFVPIIAKAVSSINLTEVDLDQNNSLIIVNKNDDKFINFLKKFIVRGGIVDEDTDFKNIRSSPIIEYNTNEYAIVNELFTIQKLYNGLYFEFKKLNDSIIIDKELNFRQYFTYNFSEKTLLYKTFDNIYGKRSYVRYSGQDIEEKFNFKGGPDYYIRNGNYIFLVENKDILLEASAKSSCDFSIIKKEIDKKIIENKGLPQIIKNVECILSKTYPFDNMYNQENCHIYPILITHRNEFDTPGLNTYLKNVFRGKLNELKQVQSNKYTIKDLTIINIDILLLYQNAFREKRLSLEKAIDAYHQLTNKENIKAKSRDEYDEKHAKTLDCFSDFVWKSYAPKQKVVLKYEMQLWLSKYFSPKIFSAL